MAGTYSKFKTDDTTEQKGVKLDMGEVGKFIVARAGGGNSAFNKRLQTLSKPHRRAIQAGTIDNKMADQIVAQVYAETVVVGWEGVTGPDDKELPFSKENAVKLLTDLPDLFRIIRETAEDHTLFLAEVKEIDAGN